MEKIQTKIMRSISKSPALDGEEKQMCKNKNQTPSLKISIESPKAFEVLFEVSVLD